jgi:hypothetical protein
MLIIEFNIYFRVKKFFNLKIFCYSKLDLSEVKNNFFAEYSRFLYWLLKQNIILFEFKHELQESLSAKSIISGFKVLHNFLIKPNIDLNSLNPRIENWKNPIQKRLCAKVIFTVIVGIHWEITKWIINDLL